MTFEGKVVIITGASSGIGEATSKLFAKEGAFVTMVDINEAKLTQVGEDAAKFDKKPFLIKANIADEEDAKKIINQTLETFGKIDVLVNNAGILRFASILEENCIQIFDELMSVNLRAVVLLTKYAAPHLIKTKGNIVNVSSTAGIKPPAVADLGPYSVSKVGVDHFTKCAAMELAAHGVRVNSVCPGAVRTDILRTSGKLGQKQMGTLPPLGKISLPEELADLIMFLASEKARSVTGSVYVCDNGMLLK